MDRKIWMVGWIKYMKKIDGWLDGWIEKKDLDG